MDIEIVKNIFDSSFVVMAISLIMDRLLDKTKYEKKFKLLTTVTFLICLCVFFVSALILIWM
jgi:hypothetical protein